VRRASAEAIARLGIDASDAVAELVAAMRDDDGAVRLGIGRAIKSTGRAGATRLRQMRDKAADAATKANLDVAIRLTDFATQEAAVPGLVAALGDKEDIVAQVAADTLGKLGDRAVDPLIEALKDKSPSVRRNAALALKELGGKAKKAVSPLIEALRNGDAATRPAAAAALGAMGVEGRPATSALIDGMLQGQDKGLRLSCAQALVQIDPDPKLAAPAFRKALRDEAVFRCAVEGLAKCGATAATELSDALKDKDAEVRQAAVEILGGLGAAARPALPALQEATRDSNARVAATARKALETIASARFVQLLNELRAKSDRPPVVQDPILMRVCQEHAKLMAKEKKPDPMPPKSPVERARDAGYPFATGGLFQIPARELNADTLFDSLVNGGAIEQLLKAEIRDIGIGIDSDGDQYYLAILFAGKAGK
jgi:HEAT repeat protein